MKTGNPRSPQSAAPAYPKLIRATGRMEVWLMKNGRSIHRVGSVAIPLALDALRHGEDMLADLFDEARRMLERRQPVRRQIARSPRTKRGAA